MPLIRKPILFHIFTRSKISPNRANDLSRQGEFPDISSAGGRQLRELALCIPVRKLSRNVKRVVSDSIIGTGGGGGSGGIDRIIKRINEHRGRKTRTLSHLSAGSHGKIERRTLGSLQRRVSTSESTCYTWIGRGKKRRRG